MSRLQIAILTFAVAMNLLPQNSRAEKPKVTVNKIDPNASVKDTLGSGDDCGIIVQDGNTYKVCPYKVTPETQSAIRSAIQGLK